MSYLNRGWRLVATGLLFIIFGAGGWLLSTIWFNLLTLVIKDEKRRNRLTQDSIKVSFKLFLKTAVLLRALDYQVINREYLKEDEGAIIVANHPTLLDYVLLASFMPRCDCIVKQSLLDNFFMRGVIKAAGYIPNTDSEELLLHCQQKLQEGGMILIFPEGTRTNVEGKITLQRGAANIALRCNADIRVICINCNEILLNKQRKWYHIPLRKPVFTITVQNKLKVKGSYDQEHVSLPLAARQLTNQLTICFESNLEKK